LHSWLAEKCAQLLCKIPGNRVDRNYFQAYIQVEITLGACDEDASPGTKP